MGGEDIINRTLRTTNSDLGTLGLIELIDAECTSYISTGLGQALQGYLITAHHSCMFLNLIRQVVRSYKVALKRQTHG